MYICTACLAWSSCFIAPQNISCPNICCIYFFVACLNFGEGAGSLEAGNRKPRYEVEVTADTNADVVNIFGGDKDWLRETRERCEQSFCAGAAGGCVGRAPGARPGTD